ncbi:MAG: excinuclease subunit UvrB [Bacteroidota bacterium]|jgi:excinuclease ABC subunit B
MRLNSNPPTMKQFFFKEAFKSVLNSEIAGLNIKNLMKFSLQSEYAPAGDQPVAIQKLVKGLNNGDQAQTLLGVTGSGKTFTMANVIQEVQRPTLILSHNKTLAAQLYGEMKSFFPDNAVEYFISYYDYYQPEAYIASSNLYIEKDLSINSEIEKLRLRATASLVSGRRDVIIVASVSCIYGIGNPDDFSNSVVKVTKGEALNRSQFLFSLVDILYNRTTADFSRGTFRVKGDTVDIFPAYADFAFRILFWGDEVEEIQTIDPETGKKLTNEAIISIFPANLFVTGKEALHEAIQEIQNEMVAQVRAFEADGRVEEAKRIKDRTEYDIEMMRELGYCSGIENYSRYFDKRAPGTRPYCLIDYFPEDFLMIVDESHVTMPQIKAMWGGDRSRKVSLVDYGFRLPSALDNRPLTYNEFETVIGQTVFVSATPADYELQRSDGVVVEQIIRPTGLLDPEIEVKPSTFQIDDLLEEVEARVKLNERVLITTLTKRMAEELSKYLDRANIRARFLHSEIKTMERVEILRELRMGVFDVLVGVNLLREGLDLPEVSLVVIMDADKEGFLRDQRSLIQTIGRAARNQNGKVIMYADKITKSMAIAMEATAQRREKQIAYNLANNITPTTVKKSTDEVMPNAAKKGNQYESYTPLFEAADPLMAYLNKGQLEKLAAQTLKQMEKAAKELDFLEAARLRDELASINAKLATTKN